MTIIGYEYDNKGQLLFVCNDTDDDHVGPVKMSAYDLIPKIHHAGIPEKVLGYQDPEATGYQMLREFWANKQNNTPRNANSRLHIPAACSMQIRFQAQYYPYIY
ncbi:MAG: hypothetical protein MZU97_01845 [Bacillus subtilis]|nr:hypothetical protein [Bacillus subtilis]